MRWTLGVLVAGVVLALPTAAAGDVTATLQGTTIVITGTDGPDTISVTANAGNVDIDTNGVVPAEFSFPIAGVTSVVVNLGAANDAFVASGNVSTMTMTIDGGAGDDTISGGNSADTVHGGDGADTITPGQGSDSVFGDAGPDTMAWNPGDNSDTFAGGDGIDRLVFTGANVNENIAVAASGTTALLTRDIGNVTETLQQVELIDISMLGGTDHYTAGTGLAAAGLQHISVDGGALADTLTGGDIAETLDGGSTDADIVSGGAGDDTLIAPLEGGDTLDGGPGTDTVAVAGTDHSETFTVDDVAGAATVAIAGPVTGTPDPATSAERVQIDALGGNDTVLMTAAAQAGVALVADGGDGDDTINGSAFGDVLHGGAGNDVLRGFGGDDQLFGDAGDDLLIGGDGADGFHCGGVGDALDDVAAGDTVDADCMPPVPPVPPAPPTTTTVTTTVTATAPSTPPPPPLAVKGFSIVSVSATRTTLSVKLRNTTASTLSVRVSASERGHAYRSVTKSLRAKATATVTLGVPASVRTALAKALNHAKKVSRKPTITVTNTATKLSTKTTRTLSLKRAGK